MCVAFEAGVGVEQEVVASAPVILPHGGEHIVDVSLGFSLSLLG